METLQINQMEIIEFDHRFSFLHIMSTVIQKPSPPELVKLIDDTFNIKEFDI